MSRLFFVTLHEFLAHPTNYFFLQCTDYFWHPFRIIFFVLSELFLITLHQLFLATVNLISGSVMHCVTLTCSSRHYENMEESVRTRIAQIAPNLIQEIDRIAQIVRTNEPSFSSARLFIILRTNRVDSADAEKDFRESTVRISDCRASSILKSVPVSQDSK